MRRIFFPLFIVLSLLSVSCSSALPSFRPYKMDIQQGNVVTSKMMLQLRPGMSKSQVRFIMGTPLIQDSFHSNRWDYFYQMRKEGKVIEQRRVILEFENEALKRVKGDVIPAGTGDGSTEETTGTSPVSQPEEKKKGLVDKLKFWEKDKKEPAQPQSAPSDLVTPVAKEPPAKEPAAKEVPPVIAVPPAAAPEPAMPEPTAPPAAPEPAPAAESKPEAKPEPAPAPVVEPAKPELVPEPAKVPEPTKVEEPAPAVAPEPAKLEPAPEPAPQKEMEAPAASQKDVVQPALEPVAEPEAKPVEKAPEQPPVEKPMEKPVEKPVAKPETKVKPTPTPEQEPVEGEPGYFEYMLQKIGF